MIKRLDEKDGDPSRGRFLAVVGPSGSGKSSLVRVGLVPALRKGVVPGSDSWFIVDKIPGPHPFEELEAALGEVLALAREANGDTFAALSAGLDRKAPWFQIKEDPQAAATTVCVILRAFDNLKTILAPILAHTTQKLHEYLGYDGQLFGTQQVIEYEEETRAHRALTYDHSCAIGTWVRSKLPPGQALRQPAPLFKKLDESVIEEEYTRLEG